jgi:hypothetical protein
MIVQRTLRANHTHARRDGGCWRKRYRPRSTHKASATLTPMSEDRSCMGNDRDQGHVSGDTYTHGVGG